jgi:FkbM family methyltransferase
MEWVEKENNQEIINKVNLFLDADFNRYLLGCNEFSINISNQLNIDGFIDDFTDINNFNNKPVKKSKALPENSIIVSCVLGRPFMAEDSLIRLGINVINYFDFEKYSYLDFSKVWFNIGFRDEVKINKKYYNDLYFLLSDDTSRITFQKIMNFRYNYDLSFLEGFSDNQKKQYFEDFIDISNDEVFLDVGGYDGYSSQYFIEKYNRYKKIFIIEPDKTNYSIILNKFNTNNKVVVINKGVSNVNKVVSFESNGISSRVVENGNNVIELCKLDEIINEPITFIKMDIEGFELTALKGASEIIKKNKPKLAICVYHKANDLREITSFIMSLNPKYRLYLRHYNEGISESVMFFIPN